MTDSNPKAHDSLFKWLISAFTQEFFAHYFPLIKIGKYRFIDKEFISKYEALKESLKGDLFLILEVEINQTWQEVAIQIEHQSQRKDIAERLFEYLCYVWLLKKKPVWSIVIYTDDAIWRKPVAEQFYYGFSAKHAQQYFHFDVIKIKNEKSSDLIKQHSLLCKLLALKANDVGIDRESLVYDIYQAVVQLKDTLEDEHLLLVNQWVDFYKNIPVQRHQQIRQEFNMDYIETSITEHIHNQGRVQGKAEGLVEGKAEGLVEGKAKGKAEGLIEGQMMLLEQMYQQGLVLDTMYESMSQSLRQKLQALQGPK
jgi:hypothetical protein